LTGKVGNGSSGDIYGGSEHEEHGLGIKRQREGGDTTESENSEKIEIWITIDRQAKNERKTQLNGSESNQAPINNKTKTTFKCTSIAKNRCPSNSH
jgi:hypothetical protein